MLARRPMAHYYITTAIDYVNNLPHIGTAYEKIGADVLARFARLAGHSVRFQMGNDEHSTNVKKEAARRGLDAKIYCDDMREKFLAIWKKLHISCDAFIQTSSPAHHAATREAFARMEKNGDIYEGNYEGWYCESCEAFYLEKDLSDGLCPSHRKKPEWIREKNFFFRLSRYGDRLREHIQKHPEFIRPKIRENEILQVIEGGLLDVSVSRAGTEWGIPLPNHPGHVVYVWFDALLNYLSSLIAVGDTHWGAETLAPWWPASLHVIGKDITRFHCAIWPAMLLSLGLPLPKTVFGHGFISLKGEKMSKSLGNIVTPLDVVDTWGPDPLRYYLLREGSFGRDGDFTWENFENRYTSDLANGLGNLLSRTIGMVEKYQAGRLIPSESAFCREIRQEAEGILAAIARHLDPTRSDDIDFHRALEAIWELLRRLDRHIDQSAPWALFKAGKQGEVEAALYGAIEGLRLSAILIAPFLPATAEAVWERLGLSALKPFADLRHADLSSPTPALTLPPASAPLFPRQNPLASSPVK